MTRKQMEIIRSNGLNDDRHDKLSCIDMINSIICYNECNTPEDVVFRYSGHYLDKYIKAFGLNNVLDMAAEQLNDIVAVTRNVFTDSEGCTYNSLVFRDDSIAREDI